MKPRQISLFCFVVLGSVGGWYVYSYFFETSHPQLMLTGLNHSHYYAGEVPCLLTSDKAGTISVWLDNKPLAQNFAMRSKSYEYPFVIPTQTLAEGSHHLKALFTDNTYHHNTACIECDFSVDNTPLRAAFIKPDSLYKVFQGRTLHVQLQTNKPIKSACVHALSQTYECYPESRGSYIYECYMPIACEEQPNEYLLSVDITDHVNNAVHLDHKLQVVMYPFKKQAITVDQERVKRAQEEGPSEREFEALLERLALESPKEKMWRGNFCPPTDIQRVTCDFGAVRTTQHKGRYAHKALDVINTPKSVIWAPQDGIVVVKDRFAASGNTVVIDHGCGVFSMLFHLEDFADINVGDKVVQGNPVGRLGQTGYATGYHLHWEMRIDNVPVDPMEWTKTTF